MSIDEATFLSVIRPALEAGEIPQLIESVGRQWETTDICQFLASEAVETRRAAALVLGLVGDKKVLHCLTVALRDPDKQVNQMVEHSLWSIWCRSGNKQASELFKEGIIYLENDLHDQAILCFDDATKHDTNFAEAYNQCGIAVFLMEQWHLAAQYFCKTVCINPEHFGALASMGHTYTQMGNLQKALQCYRLSVRINPHMHAIHKAIEDIELGYENSNNESGLFLSQGQDI